MKVEHRLAIWLARRGRPLEQSLKEVRTLLHKGWTPFDVKQVIDMGALDPLRAIGHFDR